VTTTTSGAGKLAPRADDQFSQLEGETQRRIVSKLDEVAILPGVIS